MPVPRAPWIRSSIAHHSAGGVRLFRVTHPFHPLHGHEFELITRRNNWGEDRVCFHDAQGLWRSMPASWTDVAELDPFLAIAAGRSFFRLEDMLALVSLLSQIDEVRQQAPDGEGV
ncbi:MAG: DUF5372 family protein [Chloroflexota bacterium]|nr:DUF5372 family protein [Chloroflexota bacterium]